MALRKTPLVSGEYYHIYNRGNSKQKIFHDKADYQRFIRLLYVSNSGKNIVFRDLTKDTFLFDQEKTLVSIGAYCLMPNHFHILVTQGNEGNISKFMQKLTTGYSMYYNKKYKRSGSLFQGKFKSEHAAEDRYLKYLFSYIHLNPLKLFDSQWREKRFPNKDVLIDFLDKYHYSSYHDYIKNDRAEEIILNKKAFPNYFPSPKIFKKEIFIWLSYNNTP